MIQKQNKTKKTALYIGATILEPKELFEISPIGDSAIIILQLKYSLNMFQNSCFKLYLLSSDYIEKYFAK